MLVPENDNNEEEKNSIPFHWDKGKYLYYYIVKFTTT